MEIGRGALLSPIGSLLFPQQTNSAFDYLKGALFGKPAEYIQEPSPYNQQQQQAFQQALQMGQQGIGTNAIEQQAQRGFRQNTIPLLSERFQKGFGSSGFENILQGAGTELETNLARLRQENAMNLLNLGLQPQQDYRFVPESPGIVPGLLDAGIRAGAAYLTGGTSEAGNVIDLFKKLFSGGSKSQTDIAAQPQSPLQKAQQRYNQSSGQQLLGQAYGAPPTSPYAPTGNRSVFERPLSTNQTTALNQFNQPGIIPAIRALNQSYIAGLPSAARGANLLGGLNRPYPGFEL